MSTHVEKGRWHEEREVAGGEQGRAVKWRPGSGANVQWLVCLLCLLTASVSLVTGSSQSLHICLSHTSCVPALSRPLSSWPMWWALIVSLLEIHQSLWSITSSQLTQCKTLLDLKKKRLCSCVVFFKRYCLVVHFYCCDFSLLTWLLFVCSWSCHSVSSVDGANHSLFTSAASSLRCHQWPCAPGPTVMWTCINS